MSSANTIRTILMAAGLNILGDVLITSASNYDIMQYVAANSRWENSNNLTLSDTTSSSSGVIMKGVLPFIHNFHHPTGGGAVPLGENLFIGENAGNFTTGSTATETFHASKNICIGKNAGTLLETG